MGPWEIMSWAISGTITIIAVIFTTLIIASTIDQVKKRSRTRREDKIRD